MAGLGGESQIYVNDLGDMKTRIKIPEDLSRYCDGRRAFNIDAKSVDGALSELIIKYPDLRPRLLGKEGQLLSHLILFANGKTIPTSSLSGLIVSPDDELEIMFLASGG